MNTIDTLKKQEDSDHFLTNNYSLKEYLNYINKSELKNSILYIGSRTSFFFIGTAKQALKDIPKISEWYLNSFIKYRDSLPMRIRRLKQEIETLKIEIATGRTADGKKSLSNDEIITCKSLIVSNEKQIENIKLISETYKGIIAHYKPMLERGIIETFNKEIMSDEVGIAIKIKGTEEGRFWTKTEWDIERHKYYE